MVLRIHIGSSRKNRHVVMIQPGINRKRHAVALLRAHACALSGKSEPPSGRYCAEDIVHIDRGMPIDVVSVNEARLVTSALAELRRDTLSPGLDCSNTSGNLNGDVVPLLQRIALPIDDYREAIQAAATPANAARRLLNETT